MAKPIRALELKYPMIQFLIMPVTRPSSLWKLRNTGEWQNHSFCQTKHVRKHYISRYKQQKWTKFSKTTVTIRFNLFRVFPSMSTFVLAVSLILSSNFLSAYFNVSLCLAADASVCILINLVTQLLSYGQWTLVSCPIKRFVINCVLRWTFLFWRWKKP